MVKTPTVPIPANLLVDCFIPTIKTDMTFGDSVQLNVALLDAIDACNGKIRTIRDIEVSRQEKKVTPEK
ncbi:Rz1-like lysis system protein LysC [Citrobacter werkmanii]|uniref:Rz1-like lysis system protein LysC n=1 Tax=Citrobacter europaeus TaxID=1914243 RepID=UPI003D35F85E